ncbi:hypothetical protein GF380_03145 [Candidatus Uhrbacteria bacterium]|nr:hypothetical protein [Candidatus Uhrbacteria bacterium]MBD3284138.1 hypothetical protein [Candidatus Uhrbacteria bacterium]
MPSLLQSIVLDVMNSRRERISGELLGYADHDPLIEGREIKGSQGDVPEILFQSTIDELKKREDIVSFAWVGTR